MVLKKKIYVNDSAVKNTLKKIINQTYKLLPMREQGEQWKKLLQTLVQELSGMSRLFDDQGEILFPLVCKLEGLFDLTEEQDFALYRRVIFECLGLLNELQKNVCS